MRASDATAGDTISNHSDRNTCYHEHAMLTAKA